MKIKLYQIDLDRDEKRVAFMSLSYAMQNGGVDPGIYDCVYDGSVAGDKYLNDLERVFEIFNIDKPADYFGRSMSVSDVVQIIDAGETERGFYYCDNIGFAKIEFNATKTAKVTEEN